MPDIYGPILPLQLDPRNTAALVRDTQTKIFLESDGTLNDFSQASPLAAIVEGQAYAQNELLYYLNSLPEAYTLQWLRQLGIQRSIGAKAVVTVSFIKTEGFTRSVVIPKGTKISTVSGLNFILKEQVVVGDTQVSANGIAESEKWGSIYNVQAGDVDRLSLNVLGLDGVTNFTAAQGGKDLEPIEDVKSKAFALLRRRALISEEDYLNEVRALAPTDSIIKVLTYEDRFNLDPEREGLSSSIAIVLGDENGQMMGADLRRDILKSLRKKIPLGLTVSITDPVVSPLETTLSIEYNPEKFTTGIDFYASNLNAILNFYLSPSEIDLGEKFDYQQIFSKIYELDFVESISSMSIKILQIQEEDQRDLYCNSPFISEQTEDVCIDLAEDTVDSLSSSYSNTNPIRTYRSYKNRISLISSTTKAPVTYTFVDQDYKQSLGA